MKRYRQLLVPLTKLQIQRAYHLNRIFDDFVWQIVLHFPLLEKQEDLVEQVALKKCCPGKKGNRRFA